MTTSLAKLTGLLSGLAERRKHQADTYAFKDALSDPHLARDIGLPHQPRAILPTQIVW